MKRTAIKKFFIFLCILTTLFSVSGCGVNIAVINNNEWLKFSMS